MGKQRLTTRVFRSILGASATVLLVSFCVISATLWHYFTSIQDHQLRDELECAVHGVQVSGENYLQDFKPGVYRLTWVDADGSVIYDSEAAPATLKNHFDREEIAEARANGHGSSSRYSSTLTEQTLYEAERLPDGTILRISISRATVVSLAIGAIVPVLAVILSAMLISAFVAHRISRRIIEPLNSIDLDQPLLNDTYVELTPTLERIDAQHNELKTQLATVRRRSDEFARASSFWTKTIAYYPSIQQLSDCLTRIPPASVPTCGPFITGMRCGMASNAEKRLVSLHSVCL